MPNGTLEDHLHRGDTELSWLQRLTICIGTARGLDYFHTSMSTQHGGIHRDVKTSNILLDSCYFYSGKLTRMFTPLGLSFWRCYQGRER
ncbi:putative protein kinase RLK-Pelle-CrRLK1L-1 family [Helianthus anomalus]